MNKIYSSFTSPNDLMSKSTKCTELLIKLEMRKTKLIELVLLFVILLIGNFNSFAQTLLINPALEGGFENGNTFAANGWSVSNFDGNPWIVGEANWDIWQVFIAPTYITPVATSHPGNGNLTVPAVIEGATCLANGSPQIGVQSVSIILPASLEGTTFRLIFHWKSDTTIGAQPPASIDNISLTSALPGNYFSITSGNWSAPSTWNSGTVPTNLDNATVATGTTVTIDANNQSAKNVAVSGILNYAPAPVSFTIGSTLIVGTTGIVNVFNGVTGKTLNIGGDIINNGVVNLSVGATNSGNLNLNGITLQTVSGSGSFVSNVIRNLTFANTSTVIPNIDWKFNNISVAYNLNISNAKINLGTNKLTHGISTTIHTNTGLFTSVNGGFTSGTFSRWWSPIDTGNTTSGPTAIPTEQTGRYPFINNLGQSRLMYIGRTNPTVGGQYAVKYTDALTSTSGLNIVDGTYTVTDRFNGKFVVSTEGTSPVAANYIISLFTPNAYYSSSANSRIIGQNSAISGTNQSTFIGASAQRLGVLQSDLLATSGLYLGVNTAELLFASVASGSWNSATTWNKGTVPSCADGVIISSGHTVFSEDISNVAKTILISDSGTLKITDGDLTVGCTAYNNTFVNNGTLTMSGGVLNVNGNFLINASATFNQSGGAVNVDGNDAGLTATSVASGTAIVQLNSNLLNWTGGSFTIVDPHSSATATNTLAYSNTANFNATGNHILRLGNGTSTDLGGNLNGFRIDSKVLSGRLSFNDLEMNGGVGDFRVISSANNYAINRNLTITAGSKYTENAIITYLAGNLINNGTYFNIGTLFLGSYLNGTIAASTNTQNISGSGVFANLLTGSTANLRNFTINNTDATGVILEVPLSISGNLNMVSGIINSTSVNYLTLGNSTANAILSGTPSETNMIKGPFVRVIGPGNTSFVLFPIGKSKYAPIALAPTTTTLSVIKAEAFDTNTGTATASIKNLSTSRRWGTSLLSGAFTDVKVRLGGANIANTSIPVQALTASGVYSNSFGNTAVFTAGTPNTIQSNGALNSSNFTGFLSFADSNVCTATPNPGNTLASSSTICSGESVSLSLQNQTTGVGITYQWKSATDGINYTAISGATNATLFVYPSLATPFQSPFRLIFQAVLQVQLQLLVVVLAH